MRGGGKSPQCRVKGANRVLPSPDISKNLILRAIFWLLWHRQKFFPNNSLCSNILPPPPIILGPAAVWGGIFRTFSEYRSWMRNSFEGVAAFVKGYNLS